MSDEIELSDAQAGEIYRISAQYVDDLAHALMDVGLVVTNRILLVHVMHAISHACEAPFDPLTVENALYHANCWYLDCGADDGWVDDSFAAMVENGLLGPGVQP